MKDLTTAGRQAEEDTPRMCVLRAFGVAKQRLTVQVFPQYESSRPRTRTTPSSGWCGPDRRRLRKRLASAVHQARVYGQTKMGAKSEGAGEAQP